MVERALTEKPLVGKDFLDAARRRAGFLARLARMSREERLRASRYEFDHWELLLWSARYTEEVPLVNGEYELIALHLADLDVGID